MKLGDKANYIKTITENDVNMFANITGDYNGIHTDENKAKESVFGTRIVHGMLVGGLVSTVLGMHMPGEGTIYLEQNCRFVAPVFLNDTLNVIVECTEIINKSKGIIKLSNLVLNQKNEKVLIGYSIVKVSSDIIKEA